MLQLNSEMNHLADCSPEIIREENRYNFRFSSIDEMMIMTLLLVLYSTVLYYTLLYCTAQCSFIYDYIYVTFHMIVKLVVHSVNC